LGQIAYEFRTTVPSFKNDGWILGLLFFPDIHEFLPMIVSLGFVSEGFGADV
jgi:hypothetical protein